MDDWNNHSSFEPLPTTDISNGRSKVGAENLVDVSSALRQLFSSILRMEYMPIQVSSPSSQLPPLVTQDVLPAFFSPACSLIDWPWRSVPHGE
ncbi:hypothetical protein KIN20_006863 [Parelaphostrongylus tenuis]|uniref:Uncharacterized protein n=1 Tax=Parelaphostrongylus tenuis TaxID=148309 RepID=A0AAD5QH92_PARTN|nr:hypothetical protein KIN20_006863 [Parelaphostrongylus tenuis]